MAYAYQVTDDILRDICRTISETTDAERIILFGSRAAGVARPDSDLDLLVIVKGAFGKERSRRLETGRLIRALRSFHLPIDIVLYSEDEATEWADSHNHLLSRALREGKLLHG